MMFQSWVGETIFREALSPFRQRWENAQERWGEPQTWKGWEIDSTGTERPSESI